MTKYPEHEKLKDLNGANQVVGDFIEWLHGEGLVIAEWANGSELMPARRHRDELIADHFAIDRAKLEAEKRAMLDSIRAANTA